MTKIFKFTPLVALSCILYATNAFAESQASPEAEKTEVVIIGTIHAAHYRNPKYSPDVLKDIILSLTPDAILNELPLSQVEENGRPIKRIRSKDTPGGPESWAADTVATQLGIKQIPFDRTDRQENFKKTNYFKRQKRSNRRGNKWAERVEERNHNSIDLKIAYLRGYAGRAEGHLFENSGPEIINSEAHDFVIRIKHSLRFDIMPTILKKYPAYENLVEDYHFFRDQWRERNRIMAANIIKAAKEYPGKRLVVVTGATHRYILRDLLKDEERIDLKEYWEIIKPDLQKSQESQDLKEDLPSEGTVSSLTMQQRICGLVKLWAAVKYKYALWEYAEVDWDGILPEYLALVEQSRSNDEYYLVLEKMLALLKDNHTHLMNIPGRQMLYKPNLYIEPVEGHYAVTGFYSDTYPRGDIELGHIIVAVDGKSIERMIADVKPYICASSEKERVRKALDRALWRGRNNDVTFRVKMGQKMLEVVLPSIVPHNRVFYHVKRDFCHRVIENNYGYIKIPNFWDSQIVENFTKAIESLKETKGLILDLRDNGGGNERYGTQIAGRLVQERVYFHPPKIECVPFDMLQKTTGSKVENVIKEVKQKLGMSAEPSGPWQYDRPVVILVNWRTGSAAEGFTMGLKDCGRACVAGETTLGSSGNPYYVELPGGARGRICHSKTVRLDGSRFHGVGIQPDILVKRTIKGIVKGRDETLEAGVSYLRSVKDAGQETQVKIERAKR